MSGILRKKLKLDFNVDESDNDAESEYFTKQNNPGLFSVSENIAKRFLDIELELVQDLNTLNFPKPVSCVYSPLEYAFVTHSKFVNRYCSNTKKLLFLGLNPGPWGMSQTGVRAIFVFCLNG